MITIRTDQQFLNLVDTLLRYVANCSMKQTEYVIVPLNWDLCNFENFTFWCYLLSYFVFISSNSNSNCLFRSSRHFSHVTKRCIFKNLNLRRKPNCNFCRKLLKNHFRHRKSHSNLPSWLARSVCHVDTFWKTKGCSFL